MAKGNIRRTGGNGRNSSCVAYGGLLYVGGITTVDIQGDATAQTKDVLNQIDKLLALNGTDKTRVLSASITLQYMEDFGPFNQAWDEWVTDENEPVRCVSGAALSLPEYRVMVSCVAALN